MAIICSKCGTQLPDDAKFCYKCATPVVTLSEGEQKRRFFAALEKNDTVTVRELLQLNSGLATKTESTYSDKTPIQIAVKKGNRPIVQLLLEHGANVNVGTSYSGMDTPLWMAYEANDLGMARLLLENGASVSKLTYAVLSSAGKGNKPFLQLFLQYGADVDQRESDTGFTALHRVCISDTSSAAIATLLISHGADINATSKGFNETPLHIAAYHGKLDIIELLIKHGARVNARDHINRTPLDDAESGRQYEAVKLLRSHGGT